MKRCLFFLLLFEIFFFFHFISFYFFTLSSETLSWPCSVWDLGELIFLSLYFCSDPPPPLLFPLLKHAVRFVPFAFPWHRTKVKYREKINQRRRTFKPTAHTFKPTLSCSLTLTHIDTHTITCKHTDPRAKTGRGKKTLTSGASAEALLWEVGVTSIALR